MNAITKAGFNWLFVCVLFLGVGARWIHAEEVPASRGLTEVHGPNDALKQFYVSTKPASPKSNSHIDNATQISSVISSQEWLGPLAAVALSPFFGLACLSGLATYGPEWLQERTKLLGDSSPLNNPTLFWVMAFLTIVTSLPRFTKLSKPLALAVEKLEAYSAVIILVSMKLFSGTTAGSSDVAMDGSEHTLLIAGFLPMTMDVLIAIASALNVLVINTVKFLIEILVWLTPIPFVDLALEGANKTFCAAWVGLYIYSPFLSFVINLSLFLMCAFVFFKVKRRIRYMHDIYVAPLVEQVLGKSRSASDGIRAYLEKPWHRWPALTAVTITGKGNEQKVSIPTWFQRSQVVMYCNESESRTGLITDHIVLESGQEQLRLLARSGYLKHMRGA